MPVAVSHAAQRHTEERNSSKITTSGNWNKHQPQEKLEMNQQLDLIQQKGELGLEMQDQVKRHGSGEGDPYRTGAGRPYRWFVFQSFVDGLKTFLVYVGIIKFTLYELGKCNF